MTVQPTSIERNWTPRRNGAIYCAPACGGNCTWAAYQAAEKAALDLCKHMDTPGWKPYVHENLGWHWSIVKDKLAIHPCSRPGYYFIGLHGGTPCEVSVGESFKNPNDAVKAQIDTIQSVVDKWQKIVTSVKKSAT